MVFWLVSMLAKAYGSKHSKRVNDEWFFLFPFFLFFIDRQQSNKLISAKNNRWFQPQYICIHVFLTRTNWNIHSIFALFYLYVMLSIATNCNDHSLCTFFYCMYCVVVNRFQNFILDDFRQKHSKVPNLSSTSFIIVVFATCGLTLNQSICDCPSPFKCCTHTSC